MSAETGLRPFNSSLPPGWFWTTLGEIAGLKGGITLGQKRSDSDVLRAVPYLRVANVQRGFLKLDEIKTILATEEEIDELRLRDGDILFNEGGDRDKLGRGWIWSSEIPECIHQNHVFRARLYSHDILPAFVSLYSNTFGQTYFTGEGKQTTNLASISLGKLSKLPIPIAPAQEQRRIISKLDSLLARSRRAKEALDAIPALLERFRQSVLAAAFRGDLTADWRAQHPDVEPASKLLERIRAERRRRWEEAELEKMRAKGKAPKDESWRGKYEEPTLRTEPDSPAPEWFADLDALGWSAAPLELLADPVRGIPYGIVQTGDPHTHGVPTVRCGDLKEFNIEINNLKRVDPQIAEQYSRTRLAGGEVLLAIRGTVGGVAVAASEMAGMNISREVAMVPPLPGVDPRYLMYLLASPVGARILAGHTKGVAQSGVNLDDIRSFPAPLPPLEEQNELVRQIDQALARLSSIAEAWKNASERLGALEQATLAKAFRGELVPQDPNDEPASVLLERIRAEREATTGSGRKRPRGRRPAA